MKNRRPSVQTRLRWEPKGLIASECLAHARGIVVTKLEPSRTASSRRGMPHRSAVEADLQNVAIVAIHQPSSFPGAGEGYGPKAAHTGQGKPSLPFIGGPGCASIIGGDNHRALELLLLGSLRRT